jgi:hypothetical protein
MPEHKGENVKDTPRNAVTRDDVIAYTKSVYAAEKKVPPVRQICGRFHLNSAGFYGLFNGLQDLCTAAGLPLPEKRMKGTAKASASQKKAGDSRAEFEKRVTRMLSHGIPVASIIEQEGDVDGVLGIYRKLEPLFGDETQYALSYVENYCKKNYPEYFTDEREGELHDLPLVYGVLFLMAKIEECNDLLRNFLFEKWPHWEGRVQNIEGGPLYRAAAFAITCLDNGITTVSSRHKKSRN